MLPPNDIGAGIDSGVNDDGILMLNGRSCGIMQPVRPYASYASLRFLFLFFIIIL